LECHGVDGLHRVFDVEVAQAIMLILTRRLGESIVINGGIEVTVCHIKGGQVQLGIEAPPDVRIDRRELHDEIQESLLNERKEEHAGEEQQE